MKAEYVGSVTAAYRYLLDHWQEDKKGSIAVAKRMLSTDFARAKTKYWYDFKSPETIAESLLNPKQAGGTGIYLGTIEKTKPVENSEGFNVPFASLVGGTYEPDEGDSIRLHKKDDTGRESHKIKQVLVDDHNKRWIDIPKGFSIGDSVYLLQTKSMSKRYNHILPRDLSTFRKQPGGQELPILDLSTPEKDKLSYFPEGIYVQVSTVSDMYAIQSENPVRVILELNSETKKSLIEKKETLPFSKKQIYISLDPFCPQEIENDLISSIEYLVNEGFRYWVVNNPAHISILKSMKATCIAGPYLYAFNRWATSWLENQDIDVFVSPYENSRQNLEATYEKNQRSRVLVPIFAYPALFRMRFKLPASYDFTFFSDKEGGVFKALSTEDGSFVTPEKPFSILDKSTFLKNAGFTHFLIDFSKTQVKKGTLRQLMKSFYKGEVLPDISRFNWKDGFYSPEKMEEYRNANERAKVNGNSFKNSNQKKTVTKNKPKKR